MDPTWERRPSETPPAPTKKLSTNDTSDASPDTARVMTGSAESPQEARRAVRFDSRRVRAHRAIVRELDEWFGIFAYPDPAIIYAIAPSREAAPDE